MPARRHATIVGIIALSAAVYAVQVFADDAVIERLGLVPAEIAGAWQSLLAGEAPLASLPTWSTMLTCAFVHGGVEHLLLNMVFLWAFGVLASEHLSAALALAVFVLTAICGSAMHVLLNPGSDVPTIGASGAVCGFEGLYLGLALRWELDWPDVWPLAHPIPPLQLAAFGVLGFGFDVYGVMNHAVGIAFGGHIGGFVSGFVIAGALTAVYPSGASLARSWMGRREKQRR